MGKTNKYRKLRKYKKRPRKTYRKKNKMKNKSKRKNKYRMKSKRRKQKGGLSWPFGPEFKNMGTSIGHGTKGFFKQFNPEPPSAPANPKNMNVNPLPYKGQYERQISAPYDLPDIPNFWEIGNANTKPI